MGKTRARRPWRPVAGLLAAVLAAVTLPALPVSASPSPPAAVPSPVGPWRKVDGAPARDSSGREADIKATRLAAYALDRGSLQRALDRAPMEHAGLRQQPQVVSLPAPDGTFARFQLFESPVTEAGLAAAHPEISTYAGRGLDDPTATIRADLTPLGFHASVRSAAGVWYIDPYYHRDQSVYASYFGRDLVDRHGGLVERDEVESAVRALPDGLVPRAGQGVRMRTYRVALLSDPSYAAFFGPENVTAAKVTLMNRVAQIYEDETAIRLVLVDATDRTNLNTPALATGRNGPCGTAACFTPAQLASCDVETLIRNSVVLGQLVGASRYDIGHIGLGVAGGGLADIGVVGTARKAWGCTGLPAPVGDHFAVDYVAHEMGHQFGADHTYGGNQSNCRTGRGEDTSVEPGSGSSIMSYAGICQQDNLQPHSDPYWSHRSYAQITRYASSSLPASAETQTVSLRDFDTDGDSFTLRYRGVDSAPIVRGVNYTGAGIETAIQGIAGWPAGATVLILPFDGSGEVDDTGFQILFFGTLFGQNVDQLALADLNGAGGFVGETDQGGPVGNGGHRVEQTGNRAPVVTVPKAATIPPRTPFALTGRATDADGDTVTYLWEQNDRSDLYGTALTDNTKKTGPLFRVFGVAPHVSPGQNTVTTNPTRVFPDLAQVAAGNTNALTGTCPPAPPAPPAGGASNVPAKLVDCHSEFLPTRDWVGVAGDRKLHFKLTARDGRGGIGSADVTLALAPDGGPFRVTSQATPGVLDGGSTTVVSWNVARTDAAPIGARRVRITLSTDGGKTFRRVLAVSVPNTGKARVTLPKVAAQRARIKVEAIGNIFFDLNDADFTIRAAP